MTLTKHAEKRTSQRGITSGQIETVIHYGETRKRTGGVEEYILTKKSAQQAIDGLKNEIRKIEKAINTCLVFDDNTIMTAYKSSQRWLRD